MRRKKFFVINVHEHIGEMMGFVVTPEAVVKKMNEFGVEMSILSPLVGYSTPNGYKDTMKQNDRIAEALQKSPTNFPAGLEW